MDFHGAVFRDSRREIPYDAPDVRSLLVAGLLVVQLIVGEVLLYTYW